MLGRGYPLTKCLAWVCVALCCAETGVRAHVCCTILGHGALPCDVSELNGVERISLERVSSKRADACQHSGAARCQRVCQEARVCQRVCQHRGARTPKTKCPFLLRSCPGARSLQLQADDCPEPSGCPCPWECCKQQPSQPQLLVEAAPTVRMLRSWTSMTIMRTPSVSACTYLDCNGLNCNGLRRVDKSDPVLLSGSQELCATLCRFLI
jgi:hypothetical protein